MDIKRGTPVCPGVAIGTALVLDTEGVRIPRVIVPPDQIAAEIQRFADALAKAADAARAQQRDLAARLGDEIGDILHSQASLLADDRLLRRDVEQFVRAERYNAEY